MWPYKVDVPEEYGVYCDPFPEAMFTTIPAQAWTISWTHSSGRHGLLVSVMYPEYSKTLLELTLILVVHERIIHKVAPDIEH